MTGQPVTARGARTQAALKAAARMLFESKGFQDTSVNQIAMLAEVSHGTFYTYFDSKEAIFSAVATEMSDDFMAVMSDQPPPGPDVSARIERANRGYLIAYQRNGAMMAAYEQATTLSPTLAGIRQEGRERWIDRNARAIGRWQREGIVSCRVDPRRAGEILGSMVDRTAYVSIVIKRDLDLEATVQELTRLYCNALGIPYFRDAEASPSAT